ncbi:hypothetical protein BKA82DRAFT_4020172 [Pisolithus tinctorius]|nr:hypothetical protein BKA82DRAFT_4020172 [Pisolithus tinctorius]
MNLLDFLNTQPEVPIFLRGFITYPHHNVAGLCTYITIQSGSKVWGYFNTPGSQDVSRENLFKAWDDIFADNINLKFCMIQPPGANHMVFTPQNSLTSRGHFLSYATMHLTEIATNYDCSKVPEYFPPLETFYCRPLLAMISLVESKKRKYKLAKDADHMPAMDEKDKMRKEMANELEAAKKIILHLKKALQVTDAKKELENGLWWDCGLVCKLFTIFDKYKSA